MRSCSLWNPMPGKPRRLTASCSRGVRWRFNHTNVLPAVSRARISLRSRSGSARAMPFAASTGSSTFFGSANNEATVTSVASSTPLRSVMSARSRTTAGQLGPRIFAAVVWKAVRSTTRRPTTENPRAKNSASTTRRAWPDSSASRPERWREVWSSGEGAVARLLRASLASAPPVPAGTAKGPTRARGSGGMSAWPASSRPMGAGALMGPLS